MIKKYIRVGWLIDGSGGDIQEQMLLRIEGENIVGVEPWSDDLGIEESELLDLSHCTILPPLVDAHLHLFLSGTTDLTVRKKQLNSSYEELRPVMQQHLEDCFKHGILAIRDGGDYGAYALRFVREKTLPSVTIQTSGRAWHRQGQYGRVFGRTPEEYDALLPDAFEKAMARGEDQGAEWVKIIQAGVNSLTEFGVCGPAQFSQDEMAGLVSMAKKFGKKVMAHVNGEEATRSAIEAGVDSVEHGFFMGEENLKRLRDRGVIWIPTVFSIRAYRENIHVLNDKAKQTVLDRILDHQIDQLRKAREIGVKVALGTDAGSLGVLHGEALMEEMKLFKKSGYNLSEIIECSSSHGVDLLGLNSYGKVKNGLPATFLVSRGTPSQLPRKIVYLEKIVINGRLAA